MTSTTSQPVAPAVVSHAQARRVWRGAVIAAATATKVTLAAAHILVASIVIPILTRHLRPARRPA